MARTDIDNDFYETNRSSSESFDGILQLNGLNTDSIATLNDEAVDIVFEGTEFIYVLGTTESDLGGPNGGGSDIFVAKIDRSSMRLDLGFGGSDGGGRVGFQ